jgi:hypothetical protein
LSLDEITKHPIIVGLVVGIPSTIIGIVGILQLRRRKEKSKIDISAIERELKTLILKQNLNKKDICAGLELIYQNTFKWYEDINRHFPLKSIGMIGELGEYMNRGLREPAARESINFLRHVLDVEIKTNQLNESQIDCISILVDDIDTFMTDARKKADWYNRYRETMDASTINIKEVEAWKKNLLDLRAEIGNKIIDLRTKLECEQVEFKQSSPEKPQNDT